MSGDLRQARILIVEDEPWDAELAQRLLTGAGLDFTAVVVATTEPFAQQLAAFQPDVIVSDYHLPGFSGQAALEIAQEQCPEVPFIFWSGVLGDEEAVALIKMGATDYVLRTGWPAALGRLPRYRGGRAAGAAGSARWSAARGAAAGQPRPAGRGRAGHERDPPAAPPPPARRRRPRRNLPPDHVSNLASPSVLLVIK